MAVPQGISINYEQWGLSPAAFNSYDVAQRNIEKARGLTLTGLANLLAADIAGTIDLGDNEYTFEQMRVYEGVANPGPANANWRKALAQASVLLGSSKIALPAFALTARTEGRPRCIVNAETAGV